MSAQGIRRAISGDRKFEGADEGAHPAPGRRNIGSRRISQWVLVEDDKQ